MYDWEVCEEPDGRIVAKLCGTQVLVYSTGRDGAEAWCWEVRYADGQMQSGFSAEQEQALEKAKRVAERYMA